MNIEFSGMCKFEIGIPAKHLVSGYMEIIKDALLAVSNRFDCSSAAPVVLPAAFPGARMAWLCRLSSHRSVWSRLKTRR